MSYSALVTTTTRNTRRCFVNGALVGIPRECNQRCTEISMSIFTALEEISVTSEDMILKAVGSSVPIAVRPLSSASMPLTKR